MSVPVDIVMLTLIVTSLALLGASQLRSCIRFVAIQGVIIGILPLLVRQEEPSLWPLLVSVLTISLKGVVFPRLLIGAFREAEVRHEVEPFVGYSASILWGLLALAISTGLASRLPEFGPSASSLAAPVSFFLVFVGLFVIVSRKKALTQIVGYLVLENGAYVFGVVMLPEMPLLVELGVLLDAFAAVFVMGVAVFHINREFDHIDADLLDTLKG